MSIIGKWNLWFAWQNQLPYDDNGSLVFLNTGVVEAHYAGSPTGFGDWAEEAGMMIMRYQEGPDPVFTGNVALNAIVGVMSVFNGLNQFNGSWYAVRARENTRVALSQPGSAVQKVLSPILQPPGTK